MNGVLSRRRLLAGGSLVLGFSLLGPRASPAQTEVTGGPPKTPELPGSLKLEPMLDAWIRVGADGGITVFTGKAELGQGIKTALIQLAAEQLEIDPARCSIVTADTGRTSNEGYTAGSHSMDQSGTAVMHAAAQVREILVALAADRLGVPAGELQAKDGAVVAGDGRRLGYGELVAGEALHVQAQPASRLKEPGAHRVVGTSLPRVDIPGKLTGGENAYVQDLRLPGMVHARIVRPPSPAARLKTIDASKTEAMPGVLKVVRDGSFLAVITEQEFQAVTAMRTLAAAAAWEETPTHPNHTGIFAHLERLPADDIVILDSHAPAAPAVRTVEAAFRRNYQLHGSIGPSCAVALLRDGALTVWSHAQGMFPLRMAVAELLDLPPDSVRCIHMEGAGCYGHNGADDAAADAALLARAFPGRPVRVQWMREDEHLWEPYGSAMLTNIRAALDRDGNIVDWSYAVRSHSHLMRPPNAGRLLAAQHLATPFAPTPPKPLPQPEGGGDRNAIPLYALPNARVVYHFVPDMPVRVSALRSLGAYMNVFSIESFMDELAAEAGLDPVQFRLRHLQDTRARDVIAAAAERFGWPAGRLPSGRGRGFGFARYKNLGAYAAVAVEVDFERESGRVRLMRAVAVVDAGQAVNPDGIRNQMEGGIIQSASWTLYEQATFDETRITSRDWSTYPIMRFASVPERLDVHIIDRPGAPFLGTGEAAQGPTAAAIANAVADATGLRLRELPLTQGRVKAALGA